MTILRRVLSVMPITLNPSVIESDIPARLDRLPWSRWHWLIVVALGITWVLDGLEVTLAGAVGGVLKRSDTLGLSDAQIGGSATCYLLGAVLAAAIIFLRHAVPESLRWLIVHGREHEAEEIIAQLEQKISAHTERLPKPQSIIRIPPRSHTAWREILRTMAFEQRRRSLLG